MKFIYLKMWVLAWFFFMLRIFESPSLLNQHKHPSTKSFSSYPQISGHIPRQRFCQVCVSNSQVVFVFQTWKSRVFWIWTCGVLFCCKTVGRGPSTKFQWFFSTSNSWLVVSPSQAVDQEGVYGPGRERGWEVHSEVADIVWKLIGALIMLKMS